MGYKVLIGLEMHCEISNTKTKVFSSAINGYSEKANTNIKSALSQKLHQILFPKEDKRKVRKLVQSHGFDMFIMLLIIADAIVLGLLSSPVVAVHLEQELLLL